MAGASWKRMINPTPVANVLIGAMLSAFVGCCGIDSAAAGPAATSSEAAATAQPTTKPAIAPRGRAYVFRGVFGSIFSRGMDGFTERIERAGVTANVYDFTICKIIADNAIREYRRDPAPIILIGHSMGGFCALK